MRPFHWPLPIKQKQFHTILKNNQCHVYYTCQRFLRYKCEIFILGVLWFLKTTRSFLKIPEVFQRWPKNASSLPVLFTYKIRDHEEGIVIYSFNTWFSFFTWVCVNKVLEIVSSKTATTHIFQSGVRNWPLSVGRCEIELLNPEAWDSHLGRESWQVYVNYHGSILQFSMPTQTTLNQLCCLKNWSEYFSVEVIVCKL